MKRVLPPLPVLSIVLGAALLAYNVFSFEHRAGWASDDYYAYGRWAKAGIAAGVGLLVAGVFMQHRNKGD